MNKPRCFIIIPTYNNSKEQYIRLFNSINKQTVIDLIHVVIIDDASTYKILDENFISKNLKCNFTLIQLEENHGAGYARQIGLDKIKNKAEYFCLIDADDELYDLKVIENYLNYLDQNSDIDIICGWEYNKMIEAFTDPDFFGLHGACGRIKILNTCFFPSTHYSEDHSFNMMLDLYDYKKEVVQYPTYIRHPGFLTYYLIDPFGDLVDYNSQIILLQTIANLKNIDESLIFSEKQKIIIVCTISELFYNLRRNSFDLHPEVDKDSLPRRCLGELIKLWGNRYDITEKEYEIISMYYKISSIKTIPKNLLKEYYYNNYFCTDQFSRSAEMLSIIGEILLEKREWWIPYHGLMSFKEIEAEFKKIIQSLEKKCKEILKTQSTEKLFHLPKQAINSFPYNYKICEWN